MKTRLLLAAGCAQVLACASVTSAQSAKPSFTGEWYKIEYLSQPPIQVANIKQVNGRYHVRMYNRDWVLTRNGNVLSASKFATPAEIQQNVQNLGGMTRVPLAMANAAARQHAFKFYLGLALGRNGQYFMETYRFTGQSYMYNGRLVRFYDMNPVFTRPWNRKPPLSAWYDLASYVKSNRGIVDFPFRELYKAEIKKQSNTFSLLWYSGDYRQGHEYLAINSLGRHRMSPQAAMEILKANIEAVFPDQARGSHGSTVTLGNEFQLGVKNPLGAVFPAFVSVKAMDDLSYTFETVPGKHPLRGTATFGIFKDGTGEMFLFQQGKGVMDEAKFRVFLNYMAPPEMWKEMAENLKSHLASPKQGAFPGGGDFGGGGASGDFSGGNGGSSGGGGATGSY